MTSIHIFNINKKDNNENINNDYQKELDKLNNDILKLNEQMYKLSLVKESLEKQIKASSKKIKKFEESSDLNKMKLTIQKI